MSAPCLKDIFLPWLRIRELYCRIRQLEHMLFLEQRESRQLREAMSRIAKELQT